ncbi:MAG: peptidyl-prolyl cis-trans isomerase, partial [Burkholderiales bacterium]|nr:peptidyl-prolyl cis-trans isomerase [Burkholderiales bacterium]
APGATGALASAKLLNAIFANDVLRNKHNTDAVEVGPDQLASARVVQYLPEHVMAFAEVTDQARARLVADLAAARAKSDGEQRLAALRKDPAGTLPTTATVSRRAAAGVPPQVVEAALKADASKLPVLVGVDLGSQGYVVARITQVLPREVQPGEDDVLRQQYAQAWADAESAAYYAALRKRYKAEIMDSVLTASGAAASAAAP